MLQYGCMQRNITFFLKYQEKCYILMYYQVLFTSKGAQAGIPQYPLYWAKQPARAY